MSEFLKLLARFCESASDREIAEKISAIKAALNEPDEDLRAGLTRALMLLRQELDARQEVARLRKRS